MEKPQCRVLPYAVADGPGNMAADETMLSAAARGLASIRFYGWLEPTLSIGYFQPSAARLADAKLAALPRVRRATGGEALVHDRELTYALALPPGAPWQYRDVSWARRMHEILQAALAERGVTAELCGREVRRGDFLCFLHPTPCDLLLGESKIAGSAQRRQRGALLQHGSILLAQSPATPSLPGIAELSGRTLDAKRLAETVREHFHRTLDWEFVESAWSEAESRQIEATAETRYRNPSWIERR